MATKAWLVGSLLGVLGLRDKGLGFQGLGGFEGLLGFGC